MRKYKINDVIYNQNLKLVICPIDKWQKYIETQYDIHEDNNNRVGESVAFENKEEGFTHLYIWLNSFDWTIQDQAILLHELVHHVFKVLDYCGVTVDSKSSEAFAYYFGYLVKQIYGKLKPKKKKNKK